jgi:hypothetical protein
MKRQHFILASVLALAVAAHVCAETAGAFNLLTNGDFTGGFEAGQPAQWAVVPGQKISIDADVKPACGGVALRVDIVKSAGGSLGEIRQSVKLKPDTAYCVEGLLKATRKEIAVLGIKLRKDGKEIERLATEWNGGTEWAPVACVFNSDVADEVQVLCRWRQAEKDKLVGQTVWFAGLTLKETDASASPKPGESIAATGPWTDAIRRAAAVKAPEVVPLPLPAAAGDLFLTPDGAGARTGADWANALPGNATGVLQAAWNALPPGRICRLGSGLYVNLSLKVTSGGTGPSALKCLSGEDTGKGLPWLVGDWSPKDVDHGSAFLSLSNGVSYCAFEHLRLARYQNVLFSKHGHHVGLRVRDVCGYELRFGIFLCGGGLASKPEEASHDIEIADCSFTHFTKSAVRLQGGNYDVRVLNCTADAGGKAWMLEAFHIAYNIQGDSTRDPKKDAAPWAEEHDIIFVNCVARNCIYAKARYWQGDGYCAERGIKNLAFINCAAFDCADGGWDVKSDNVLFVNCVSLRNKMNYRLWGTAYLFNSLSANAFKRGGSWTEDGFWSIGTIRASHLTIANNATMQVYADSKGEHTADITFERCLVASCVMDDGKPAALYSNTERVKRVETAEWCPAAGGAPAAGEDPQFKQPAAGATWTGEPADAFDSQRYGSGKGYASATALAWRAQPAEQVAEAARGLLKHAGWEDLKRRVEAATASLSGAPRKP